MNKDKEFYINKGRDYLDNIFLKNENRDLTMMFEVVSPWNRIVVPYDRANVFHLATRITKTGEYVDHNLGWLTPKVYSVSNLEGIVETAKNLPFDKEGYVVVDKFYKKIKIKSPAYVVVHHLKNNGVVNKARILDLIRLGEDEEFSNYFPEYSDAVTKVRKAYDSFILNVNDQDKHYTGKYIALIEGKIDRKEFAAWATKTMMPPYFFSKLDGKVDSIEDFIIDMPSDRLLKHIMKGQK